MELAWKGRDMNSYQKFPKKQLYIILLAAAVIIFASSLDVLMRVKDATLFEAWKESMLSFGTFTKENPPTLDDYVGAELFKYLFKIAIPVGFALLTFLTYQKLTLTKLYIFIWTVLLVGGMAYTFFELNFYSVFFYLVIAGYLILIMTVLSLFEEVNKSKKL